MNLRRLILLAIILFPLSQMTQAQPIAVPLNQNPALSTFSDFQADAIPVFEVFLPILSNQMWCPHENLGLLSTDSLTLKQIDCGDSEIEVTLKDSCIVFSTTEINYRYRDTLCFTYTIDDEQEEQHFKLDIVVSPPHPLPFIDDFSNSAPYPDEIKWQDKDVYINNSLALDPPSLGVATFDGINRYGRPYDSGYGRSDFLTSTFIDLEGQFNAHIRFWYQARGLGFDTYPRIVDSLVLEFKTPTGQWNRVWSVQGPGREETEEFQSVSIPIPAFYASDHFQFRFVNYSDNNGMLSFWHLDYILVTAQKLERDGIQDVAFTRPAESILYPYRAMPYKQFKGNEDKYIRTEIDVELYNHFNSTQLANPSRYIVSAIKGNQRTELLNETLLEVPPTVDENQRNLDPGQHRFRNRIKLRSSDLIPALKDLNYDAEDDLQLVSEMLFENAGEPTQLNSNNQTSYIAELSDHIAYDDGTAEVGIYIPSGTYFPTVVQKYTLETEDTLKAVRFHFPLIRPNMTNQRYNIVVYQGELNEDSRPIYEEIIERAIFPSSYQDSLGGFTTFAFKEHGEHIGLAIPAGDFYVGWQQISANTEFGVYVGFDRNSPDVSLNGNILYSNDGTTWHPYTSLPGALMIRPVFGRGQPISTAITTAPALENLKIYPNPASDYIIVKPENGKDYRGEISIFGISGQEIYRAKYSERIDFSGLPSGKYHIHLTDDKGVITHGGSFIRM